MDSSTSADSRRPYKLNGPGIVIKTQEQVDGFAHFETWPEPLKLKVQERIDAMEADESHDINDYGDNRRICRMANAEEVAIYEEALKNGCCGYSDEVFEIDGVKIKFGFNYGH